MFHNRVSTTIYIIGFFGLVECLMPWVKPFTYEITKGPGKKNCCTSFTCIEESHKIAINLIKKHNKLEGPTYHKSNYTEASLQEGHTTALSYNAFS